MAAKQGRRRGEFRASHADREQVIGALKAAFVQGMLSKDEFDQRVAQAFGSRTYAELAPITADLRVEPVATRSSELARPGGAQPVLRPGVVMAAATAFCGSVWAFTFLPPWPLNSEGEPPRGILVLFLLTNLVYLCVFITAVVQVLINWCDKHFEERPSRRQITGPDVQ
ncbi:MAG TPA: DUF1707 domain-containing protein [Streptosporangiaceae bacterium]|nr:DUF1707 domain-containing protein [Streptosporangiaceae bacterium]